MELRQIKSRKSRRFERDAAKVWLAMRHPDSQVDILVCE
jgi:hypothetical protein